MSIISYFSKPSASSRLSLKEQNRLNEAAKIRVANILGVKRTMIDLTDDEPPRKVARLGNNSRNEFRNSVSTATAPSPSMPAANLQEIIRTQSISSPRNSTNNQTSSSNADQTHSRKRTASGSKPFSNASLEKMMYAPMDYGGRPQSGSSNPPSRPNHLPGQSSMPGPALQDELRGLVGYQAPTLHNSPHIGPQVVQPQVPNPRAPSRYNSPYVSPQVVQTQGPNALAPQPQSTDLAHPLDLLNNISLSVASLETFQLQQILSTAALRHPDVLEHLRTSFRIQETNKSTAHQALLDLLRAQSQGELRIARLQEERSRKGSAYNASPYGPTPSNAPAAPAYNASPYGPPPPNAPAVPPFAASAAPTQAPGPASSHADLPPQTAIAPNSTSGGSPGLDAQEYEQDSQFSDQASKTLPSKLSLHVIRFHHAINQIFVTRNQLTDEADLDALRSLISLAFDIVKRADTAVKTTLRKDEMFTEACWRIFNLTLEKCSTKSRMMLKTSVKRFVILDKARDGCFVGYAEFLSAFKNRAMTEWRKGVRELREKGEIDQASDHQSL